MTIELTARQQAAKAAVIEKLGQGVGKQLVSLPTGTGKTVLACAIAREFERALFLCHRQELVEQTQRTMARIDPDVAPGIIAPGEHRIAAFTIGMIQSAHRRLGKIDPRAFDLVIIDEAHHAAAKTWREVADHFQPRLRLGLSATPERWDGAPLSNLFDEIAYSMSLAEAVDEGLLAPPTCLLCRTATDLSKVRVTAGELNEGDLQEAVNTKHRNEYVVQKYLQHAAGRRAVAFTAGIKHAQDLAAAFSRQGVVAGWVSGADADRAEKVAAFARGEYQVLCNAMILTEGWDDPGVEAVLLARPTQSRTLYAQMLGRGLRKKPGKADCVIVDFVDNATRHELMAAWKFLGKRFPPSAEYREPWTQGGGESRQMQVQASDVEVERIVDLFRQPEQPAFNYGDKHWHYAHATEKQLAMLESKGYDVVTTDWTRGQACQVISNMPASRTQLRLLSAHGFDAGIPWTRGQAGDAIAAATRKMESALARISRAGFSVEIAGKRLNVHPQDRLNEKQRGWIASRQKAIVAHLRANQQAAMALR